MAAISKASFNRLWLARQRTGLSQKQVSTLLGQHWNEQLSRYERGTRTPDVRVALSLELLYSVPVRILFEDVYKKEQQKLVAQLKRFPKTGQTIEERLLRLETSPDFCTYFDLLNMPNVSQAELISVRRHVKNMLDKMNHL